MRSVGFEGPVSGFSLIEVLLATTTLLWLPRWRLFRWRDRSRTRPLGRGAFRSSSGFAESRINEILAGAERPKEIEKEEIYEYPGWNLSVQVDSVTAPAGLVALRVTVFREADDTIEANGIR